MAIKKVFGLSLVALLAANAYAEGEAPAAVNVTTLAKSAHLGLQYRAAYVYDNKGINKIDDTVNIGAKDPTKTSIIAPEVAKLVLNGDLTDNSNYKATYNFLSKNAAGEVVGKVEYFKFTWMPIENFGVELGQDKIKQAGFESTANAAFTMMYSHYYDYNLPFEKYAPVVGLFFNAGGKISLQMTNDNAGSAREYATYSQPATILEYAGDFGGIKPLVQLGIYDEARSKYFTLGVMYAQDALSADFNYTMDQRNDLVPATATDEKKDETNTLTNIALNVSYNLGAVEPFFKFTMFDQKQHTDDMKGNNFTGDGVTAPIVNGFSDNGQNILLGSYFMSQGKQLKPYAALLMTSAKFYKAEGAAAADDETETRSNMKLMVGAAGEF